MNVVVTGGGGFLGLALCRALVERGFAVSSLARGTYSALAAMGVRQIQADLVNLAAVTAGTLGAHVVFHVAAKAGTFGDFREFFDINVKGTRNVLSACRMNRIPYLIYTSTPSVTHVGRVAVEGGTADNTPIAAHFKSAYAATKALAEAAVLAENDTELASIALRPRLIWGPGDNHLLPRFVELARRGRMRLVGDGQARIDTTYIDNAVAAHLSALDGLRDHRQTCAGKAYFISNGEPKPIAEIINGLLHAAGCGPVEKYIGFHHAYLLGRVCEWLWTALPLRGEPPMTRFIAEQLVTSHWYDLSPARLDFGYTPKINIREGLERTASWWRERG